jgi:hypothetical protein
MAHGCQRGRSAASRQLSGVLRPWHRRIREGSPWTQSGPPEMRLLRACALEKFFPSFMMRRQFLLGSSSSLTLPFRNARTNCKTPCELGWPEADVRGARFAMDRAPVRW